MITRAARACLALFTLGGISPIMAQDVRVVVVEHELIPSADTPPFGQISAVLPGADATWVIDPGLGMIHRFDTLGAFVGATGGKGRAEGQYQWPIAAGLLQQQIWVWDQQLARVSILDADLSLAQTRAVDPYRVSVPSSAGWLSYDAHRQIRNVPVVRHGAAGEVLDTIAWVPRSVGWVAIPRADGTALRIPQPLSNSGFWDLSPRGDGLVLVTATQDQLARGDGVAVTRISARGDTSFTARVPLSVQRLTSARVEIIAKGLLEIVGGDPPIHSRALEAVLGQLDVPEYLPPLMSVTLDTDDRIWMELQQVEAATPRWLVLDADGQMAFTVVADDSASRLFAARGARVWLVSSSADGETRVHQYRLEKP